MFVSKQLTLPRIKDGLIYVAMSLDELSSFPDNAQQDDALRPPRSPPRRERAEDQLSFLESLRDPEISHTVTQRQDRDFSPFSFSAEQTGSSLDEPDSDSINEWESAAGRRQRHHSASPSCEEQLADTHPERDANVTLLSDDEIDWEEEPTPADVLEDRRRRERNMSLGLDGDDHYGWDRRFRSASFRFRHGHGLTARPSAIEGESHGGQDLASQKQSVVRARFHIKNGNHKVAIKFDPPM